MLLCIDIGNTNIKLGLFYQDELRHHWRIATDRNKLADEYTVLLLNLFSSHGVQPSQIRGCAISSVVPTLTPAFDEFVQQHLKIQPVIIGARTATGMEVHTEYPAEVGADLIVNAFAARKLYGTPVIIVGCGTATTLSAVSTEGHFEGVAIAPGIATGAESLFRTASVLPLVELARPERAIGKNTIQSMQSGLIYGYAALVEGLVSRMRSELGGTARVVATGGLANLIAKETPAIEIVEPNLALIGLKLIYEQSHPAA